MADSESQTLPPPREWLEDFKRKNPGPDPDNFLYLINHQRAHLGNHNHVPAVAKISDDIKSFYASSTPFRIYHGSTNSTRPANFKAERTIDTSNLDHVLYVDHEKMTCQVEPNVAMDTLVEFLQPFGLVPPVVMEFPGITVGGGFAGTSGESSSFKHGFFDKTVVSIEIVLGNGEVVSASEKERPDLFAGAAGSFGTLGVVTLLEVKLVTASFWVELTYHPITSTGHALQVIKEKSKDKKVDYLDGIIYSKDRGVIVTGRRHNESSLEGKRVVRFTRDSDPWFYLHARDALKLGPSQTAPHQDVTVLKDYLFRYDRGAFWTGRYAFGYFMVPFNWVTRLVLDRLMHTRVMYHALHKSGQADLYIIQDLAIPFDRSEELIDWVDAEFGLYPLWLCPLKIDPTRRSNFHPSASNQDLMINIGVWGPGPRSRPAFVEKNRLLENKVKELGGMKWLYAHAYYTEEEFWSIYERKGYDVLRAKYHAERLPTVYDKVHTPIEDKRSMRRKIMMAVWPLSGIYGVLMALLGGSYLVRGGVRSPAAGRGDGRDESHMFRIRMLGVWNRNIWAIRAVVIGAMIGFFFDVHLVWKYIREQLGI